MRFAKALSAAAIVAAFSILLMSSASAYAAVDNDQGEVTYYTYTCNFMFEGTDAQYIEWDFGFDNPDGTRATSTEWNPSNVVFPAKGRYTVTQTVSNTVGTYTSQIIVNILGTPEITYESNGGSEVFMQIVKVGETTSAPTAPVKEGFEFGGWYYDSDLKNAVDFSQPISQHVTYYAKWIAPGASDEGADSGSSDNEDESNGNIIASAVAFIVGLIGLAVTFQKTPSKRSKFIMIGSFVLVAVGLGSFLLDIDLMDLFGVDIDEL